MSSQVALPCVIMRGGSSRGPYLHASDLPADPARRDAVLLALMGSPHGLQVDGIGGAQPQTSKVAIVSASKRPGVDVDYLFAQVAVETASVDTKPNCGNMLAGVGPFAIESGLVAGRSGETTVRIFNVNTQSRVDALVQTPGGVVTYDGDTAIPGVHGTAAPVQLIFRDVVGSKTGKLLPTGLAREEIDGVPVTLIDGAMPMMLIHAEALGLASLPTPDLFDGDATLLERSEKLRLEAGRRMGFGDVTKAVVPKVGIIGADADAHMAVTYLMPWRAHKSLAVTGAVTLAMACDTPGSLAHGFCDAPTKMARLKHPSGIMELGLERGAGGAITGMTVTRTARRLFEGRALLPRRLFD